MSAYLIYGGKANNRRKQVIEEIKKRVGEGRFLEIDSIGDLKKISDAKVIEVQEDKKSIGISQIRDGLKFFLDRPIEHTKKVLLILEADRMTRESQNALLKTLEEPQDYEEIFLESKAEDLVLNTVKSRCKRIMVKDSTQTGVDVQSSDKYPSLSVLIKMSQAERFEISYDLSKEESEFITQLLEEWLGEGRSMICSDSKLSSFLNLVYEVKTDLEKTNLGKRLAVERLLLLY